MQPSIFLSDLDNHCLTFFWKDHPNWYIGYRLIEGTPYTSNIPSDGLETQPGRISTYAHVQAEQSLSQIQPPYPEWLTDYQQSSPDNPTGFSFQSCVDGMARCSAHLSQGPLDLAWFFDPVEDGIWITLQVTTQASLTGVYGMQQCLRLTGNFNEYWRRKVAITPFLSEFDLQAMGQPNLTLSFARQQGQWFGFPVPYTILATSSGLPLVESNAQQPIDHGLVLRQSLDRRDSPNWYWGQVARGAAWNSLTAGMYWERTLLISNRHPADCLHAVIDVAPLQAGQTRTIHGKFYCIEGSKDDLLEHWCQDFQ
jgi:hypothetical protein